jgi:hypothetical protein
MFCSFCNLHLRKALLCPCAICLDKIFHKYDIVILLQIKKNERDRHLPNLQRKRNLIKRKGTYSLFPKLTVAFNTLYSMCGICTFLLSYSRLVSLSVCSESKVMYVSGVTLLF